MCWNSYSELWLFMPLVLLGFGCIAWPVVERGIDWCSVGWIWVCCSARYGMGSQSVPCGMESSKRR